MTNHWNVINVLEKTPLGDLCTVVHGTDNRRTSALLLSIPFPTMQAVGGLLCSENGAMQRRALALSATAEVVESGEGTLVVYDTPAVNSLKRNIESRLLSFEIALDYCLKIIEAVRDLHAHGVVHGALSLEQVILAGGETIRVIGYGLTPAWGKESEGYLPYLDPCAMSASTRTPESDLYGMGIMMYRIATGQFPFTPTSLEEVAKRSPDLPPAIGKRSSNWPIHGFDVIKRATSLNKAERYPTATALRNALTRLSSKPIQDLPEPTIKSQVTPPKSLLSRLFGS